MSSTDDSSDVKMEDAKVTARIPDDWSEFMKDREDKDREIAIEAVKAAYAECKKEEDFQEWSEDAKVVSLRMLTLNSLKSKKLSRSECETAVKILEGKSDQSSRSRHRDARITDGLEKDLAHNFDLEAFSAEIENLFGWFTNKRTQQTHVAPYFALVQSSGMGKTKLFTEYRKQCNGRKDYVCITILCVKAALDKEKREKYFDKQLRSDANTDDSTHMVCTELDDMIKSYKDDKIVLLFDEAQGLMHGKQGDNDRNLMFRSIRWWLRQKRKNEVVAVFAGTTARLTNFYPSDIPPQSVSRLPDKDYWNYSSKSGDKTTKLYPPFFALNTIGCLIKRVDTNDTEDSVTLDTAAQYGRPLFAYYQEQEQLRGLLPTFCKRLVLSEGDYATQEHACYSVLGSRVQMGVVDSFQVSSKLVSSGYACLVAYSSEEQESRHPKLAYSSEEQESGRPKLSALVTFMHDPVCATLVTSSFQTIFKVKINFFG